MQILEITDLRTGELIELERVFLCKETQFEYAGRLQISEGTLHNWESGKTKVAKTCRERIEKKRQTLKKYLTLNVQCYFARKRFGMTQQQLAKDLGFCRYWVAMMENGDIPMNQKMIEYFSPGN